MSTAARSLPRPVLQRGRVWSVRPGSALARVRAVLAVAVPPAARWLVSAGRRLRTAGFYAGSLSSVCYGAWQISEPLGWVTIGVALFLFEGLTWREPDR